MGNAFLHTTQQTSARVGAMGLLARLTDELVLDILRLIEDPYTLARVSCCSKVLYVFASQEELWKPMVVQYLEEHPVPSVRFQGSWKRTMCALLTGQPPSVEPDIKLEGDTSLPLHCLTDFRILLGCIVQPMALYCSGFVLLGRGGQHPTQEQSFS